jgi:hypothetical protein
MKGPVGIIIAVVLGLAGMAFNWIYITNRTKADDTELFLGVRDGVNIKAGEVIKDNDLVPVPVRKMYSGRLKDYFILYDQKQYIVNDVATRDYASKQLIPKDAARTPSDTIRLGPDEELIWIPVDANSFVSQHVQPGDLVTFQVPTRQIGAPTSAAPGADDSVIVSDGPYELVGPFTVKTIGVRLGDADIYRARRVASSQENLIGIAAKREGAKYDAKTHKLLTGLQRGNYRNVRMSVKPKGS